MAAPGKRVDRVVPVAEAPAAARDAILGATSGAPGYNVTADDDRSIVLTRQYTPTRAILWALLLIPFFPLIFLYRVAEALQFTIEPDDSGSGTLVMIAGSASDEMLARIDKVMSGGLWLHVRP